jgi:hypothetical protein
MTGICDSVFGISHHRGKIFAKKLETPYVGEFTKDTIGLNGISGLWFLVNHRHAEMVHHCCITFHI